LFIKQPSHPFFLNLHKRIVDLISLFLLQARQ